MTIKQYAKKHELSLQKVKSMLPKLEGIIKCENCGKFTIPADAIPIYIPDKNKYRQDARKFCYVMDAISNKMRFDQELSSISQEECQRCLKILREADFIVLDASSSCDISNPLSYTLSIKGFNWKQSQTKDKNQMILEILKTIQSVGNATAACLKIMSSTSP